MSRSGFKKDTALLEGVQQRAKKPNLCKPLADLLLLSGRCRNHHPNPPVTASLPLPPPLPPNPRPASGLGARAAPLGPRRPPASCPAPRSRAPCAEAAAGGDRRRGGEAARGRGLDSGLRPLLAVRVGSCAGVPVRDRQSGRLFGAGTALRRGAVREVIPKPVSERVPVGQTADPRSVSVRQGGCVDLPRSGKGVCFFRASSLHCKLTVGRCNFVSSGSGSVGDAGACAA